MTKNSVNIVDTLRQADEKTLREVLRQAEDYLNCQLTSAIAADLRAVTLSGILAAALPILVTAVASTTVSKGP